MRSLSGLVSPEAHAAWHDFASYHGITVSSLLEVVGQRLHIVRTDFKNAREFNVNPAVIGRLVEDARVVAASRHSSRYEKRRH